MRLDEDDNDDDDRDEMVKCIGRNRTREVGVGGHHTSENIYLTVLRSKERNQLTWAKVLDDLLVKRQYLVKQTGSMSPLHAPCSWRPGTTRGACFKGGRPLQFREKASPAEAIGCWDLHLRQKGAFISKHLELYGENFSIHISHLMITVKTAVINFTRGRVWGSKPKQWPD